MVKCEGTKVEIIGNVIDVMAETTLLCENMSRILKKETDENLAEAFKDGLVKACDGYFEKKNKTEEKPEKKSDDDELHEAVKKILDELKTMREEK